MQILLDAEGELYLPCYLDFDQESIGAPPPSPTVENDYVLTKSSATRLGLWGQEMLQRCMVLELR